MKLVSINIKHLDFVQHSTEYRSKSFKNHYILFLFKFFIQGSQLFWNRGRRRILIVAASQQSLKVGNNKKKGTLWFLSACVEKWERFHGLCLVWEAIWASTLTLAEEKYLICLCSLLSLTKSSHCCFNKPAVAQWSADCVMRSTVHTHALVNSDVLVCAFIIYQSLGYGWKWVYTSSSSVVGTSLTQRVWMLWKSPSQSSSWTMSPAWASTWRTHSIRKRRGPPPSVKQLAKTTAAGPYTQNAARPKHCLHCCCVRA